MPKESKYFLPYHTHVTIPYPSERDPLINTRAVIERLDEAGMEHTPVPLIWDGLHLVDEGRVAGPLEIELRVSSTYQSRMNFLVRFLDEIWHWSLYDKPLYDDLAECLRRIEYDRIRGKTTVDRAIANVAIIQTAKRSLHEGIPPDATATQINWALEEVGRLSLEDVELFEFLPDEEQLTPPSSEIDFQEINPARGAANIQLIEKRDPRQRVASLLGDCLAGVRSAKGEQKELHPLSLRRLDLASRFLAEPKLDALLEISRIAEEFVSFQPKFDRKMVPSLTGEQKRSRMMRSLDEISRISPYSWALKKRSPALFRYRLITRAFTVQERIERTDRKQLFYALFDSSKSMQKGERIYKLAAIFQNRLRAVVRGEAILGYAYYDSMLHDETWIETREQAFEAMASLHHELLVGDDTDVSTAIRLTLPRIQHMRNISGAVRPELVIVTDGDDYLNVTLDELGDVVLHVFVVEETNEELLELARQSGGVALDEL